MSERRSVDNSPEIWDFVPSLVQKENLKFESNSLFSIFTILIVIVIVIGVVSGNMTKKIRL